MIEQRDHLQVMLFSNLLPAKANDLFVEWFACTGC